MPDLAAAGAIRASRETRAGAAFEAGPTQPRPLALPPRTQRAKRALGRLLTRHSR